MLDWQHRVTYSFVKRQRTKPKTKVKNREKHIALSASKTETRASKLALSDIVSRRIYR